jgi:hypothetical protein
MTSAGCSSTPSWDEALTCPNPGRSTPSPARLTLPPLPFYVPLKVCDGESGGTWAWSPSSAALSPASLAPSLRAMLGAQLLGKAAEGGGTAKVPVEELAGKVVGKQGLRWGAGC